MVSGKLFSQTGTVTEAQNQIRVNLRPSAVLVFLRVHSRLFFCALCALLRLLFLTLRFYAVERSNERDSGKPESRRTSFRGLTQ